MIDIQVIINLLVSVFFALHLPVLQVHFFASDSLKQVSTSAGSALDNSPSSNSQGSS